MNIRIFGIMMISLTAACSTTSCNSTSATSSSLQSEQQQGEWQLSYFASIPVRVALNEASTDALKMRKILVLLDEKYFNQDELKELFTAMAAQYDQPEFLIISALSDREMLQKELEKKVSTTNYTVSEDATSQELEDKSEPNIKYFRAYYLRLDGEERFGYRPDPEKKDYVTVYLKRREVPYTGDINADLTIAAREGDTIKAQDLLARGASLEARDQDGNTPLIHAALGSHADIVTLLLAKGANVNAKGEKGYTALICAAELGNNEILKALLHKGADINARNDYGDSSLIKAAYFGKAETVRALLAKGANVNAVNKEGRTALMIAAANSEVETVKVLLASGADVNAKNKKGETAFSVAKGHRRDEVLGLIRNAQNRR